MGSLAVSGNARTRKRYANLSAVAADPIAGADFTDTFNRSDRTLNGDNGWTVSVPAGSVTIGSNQCSFNSPTSGAWAVNTGSPTPNANHWAAAAITGGSSGNIIGCLGRYNDNNNFYVVRMSRNAGDVWELYKRVSGSYTLLNSLSETAPAEPWYMRIYLVGTSIKGQLWSGTAWVDKVSATDSAHATGTPGMFGQKVSGASAITCDPYASGTAV